MIFAVKLPNIAMGQLRVVGRMVAEVVDEFAPSETPYGIDSAVVFAKEP